MIGRLTELLVRRAGATVLLAVVALLGTGAYGAGAFDALSQGGFDDPGSEGARAVAAERELFGNRGADVVAVYTSDRLEVTDPAFQQRVEDALAALPPDAVATVTTYYDTQDPSLVSADGRATQVLVSLEGDSQDALLRHWEEIEPTLQADGLRTEVAGAYAVYSDVNRITEEDLRRAELVSLPIVLLLSLLIFRSVAAALMPVVVGVFAVVGAMGVIRLLTTVTEVSVFSVNVITLLGLGLAVDYALFVVSRFREELARYDAADPDAVPAALRTTMATAGRTVLFSGLTVAAALSSLLVFPQAFLRSMGYGGIAAVTVAMVSALTVLPAVLRLLGRRIDAGRVPFLGRATPATEDGSSGWARLARGVMRRPALTLVGVTGVLLLVASPFLGVTWGSVDHRVLPSDAPSRVAAERIAADFGGETSTAGVVVQDTTPSALDQLRQDLARVDGVAAVQPVAAEGGDALLRVSWQGNSQSEDSQRIVEDLREVDPVEGTALVGGLAADTVDLIDSIGERLPWMGLIVVGVMLVLLFLAFGSLVLPVKAVLMNAVSITASFGVVTWIFADGNLEGALGFESQGFLDATQPILMLAILFGLSMDYEVFLLSRVREEWDRTGDNARSVALGVQRTGRIITSAALLLAVVIGAFSTSGIVFMKLIGIGMLVALLVDATVVRALLVPATMELLGDANWWAPGPLRRWWERHGFREEAAAPATVAVAPPERVGVGT